MEIWKKHDDDSGNEWRNVHREEYVYRKDNKR